jgi:hypothetical protein
MPKRAKATGNKRQRERDKRRKREEKDARRKWRKDMRARGLDPDAMSPDGVDLNAMPEDQPEGEESGDEAATSDEGTPASGEEPRG